MLNLIRKFSALVKFSHTVFAMPFAIIGFFLAVFIEKKTFGVYTFIKPILCVVFARNIAMAFNRFIDADFDKKNFRTSKREIPSGIIKKKNVLIFILLNIILFEFTTYLVNNLCFYLSFVALILIMAYSLMKRFTPLCHLILGIGLSLAPVGAFISITSYFTSYILLLGLVVALWVMGFDIIYSLQDYEFDKKNKLFSIPVWIGIKNAIVLSKIIHTVVFILILSLGYIIKSHIFYFIGSTLFGLFLFKQHREVSLEKFSNIESSFFTNNGAASMLFSVFFLIDLVLFKR